jgi:hypothetical protein
MVDKYDRFTGQCPTCAQKFYKEAYDAAVAYIEVLEGQRLIAEKSLLSTRKDYLVSIENVNVEQEGVDYD